MKTTWRKAIREVTDAPLIACTLSEEELDVEFDDDLGLSDGKAFTAWTGDLVLFPVDSDGAEWVASVPRNPCDIATKHVGGGGT